MIGRIVWHGYGGHLEEFIVEPIPTTLTLHKRLVDANAITDGSYNIRWLEEVFLTTNNPIFFRADALHG